jgi:transposase-like protein
VLTNKTVSDDSKKCRLVRVGWLAYSGHIIASGLQAGDGRSRLDVRAAERKNYRNGSYRRRCHVKRLGELHIEVPRERNGPRNVLAKVPQRMRGEVADRIRDVFYAPSREKARVAFDGVATDYESTIPSAVGCMRASLDACLTFYSFPEHEWMGLRTTNSIEREQGVQAETKPMEVLAGERSAYTLLCFMALKIEQF